MKMAREFAHLTWLKSKKDARHNLGSSSILTVSLEEVGPFDMSWQVGDANPAGDPELVGLVSETYGVERDRVFITMGAGEANLHAAMVCVEKGCDVLVERPVYHSLAEVSRFLGARVVHFDRRLENGFGIDLEDLKRRLTRKCRLVVLTNLHNPSCAMLDRETVKAVAEIAADRGARVLSDEVYLDCGGAAAPPSMAALADNAFATYSLSKAYGAGGFRMGWMLAAPGMVRAVKRIRDHTSIAPNRIGEEITKNILRRRQWFLDRTRSITERNIASMERWVSSRDDVKWSKPPAGTICFPRILKKMSTIDIGQRYYDREGGLVCPGEFFFRKGHFRIGLGGDPEKLWPALEALGKVLDEVR
jgi:aspartate/methionine/tyrosine aminotransferase